jgi:phospholipase A1
VLQKICWGHGDLWIAYTQKSFCQIYNTKLTRLCRKINYKPKIILNFFVNFKTLGFNARMFEIAFNHLSNGKSDPFSRSLNRE